MDMIGHQDCKMAKPPPYFVIVANGMKHGRANNGGAEVIPAPWCRAYRDKIDGGLVKPRGRLMIEVFP